MNKTTREFPAFFTITSLLALILPSTSVFAANKDTEDTPWYQIEVIIFANLEQNGLASETWPDNSILKHDQVINLRHPDDAFLDSSLNKTPNFQTTGSGNPGMPVAYELIPKSQLQLVPVVKKLQRSASYQPLLHIAWRQPTLDPKSSRPVYIFNGIENPTVGSMGSNEPQAIMQSQSSGENRFSSVPVARFSYDSSQYGQLFPATEGDTLVGATFQKLSGTLRLSVSRYLHLELDLNYRIPVLKEEVIPVEPEAFDLNAGFTTPTNQLRLNQLSEQQEPQTYIQRRQALQNFHLYETRRLRSKEIHYYDHPMYGVIARVVPYELPKVEENFDPAAQAFTSGEPATPKQ